MMLHVFESTFQFVNVLKFLDGVVINILPWNPKQSLGKQRGQILCRSKIIVVKS